MRYQDSVNKFKIGQRIKWVPREANDPDWGRNDECNNEFWWSAYTESDKMDTYSGSELTEQEMDEYMDWSEKVQQGTVTALIENEGFVQIELLEPFGRFTHVTYPWDADLGEYWARVQESPDFKLSGGDNV